jgi:hypothetical protein
MAKSFILLTNKMSPKAQKLIKKKVNKMLKKYQTNGNKPCH